MRIRWRGLELPARVVRDQNVSTEQYGRFIVEPFERGFGTTVGNSLRRILLSSLEGSSITQVRIAGADHEFCSLPGVLEDVTDIILNIKAMVVDLDSETPKRMRVERHEPGEVRAGDFDCDPAIMVVNPDHVIATLTDAVTFSAEFVVARGRGYVPAEDNIDENAEAGIIAVDSLFSPVTRVRYRTEDTRVGQKVNYDRLILEVWTKGIVMPEDALVEAAKILRKHLNPFVLYHELGEQTAAAESDVETEAPAMDETLRRKLDMPVANLELSVRANNCLEAAKIGTVGELVRLNETELLQLRSFGRTSLIEVKRKLANMGLGLGMSDPGQPVMSDGAEELGFGEEPPAFDS
ncbi:MAG: DNA-directed RNA polymerase subunit alpha [Phycisphaerae bacterium]|nr:DNA-directed RNA polymerase subunit alpha [Phycisphaerae bacterium]